MGVEDTLTKIYTSRINSVKKYVKQFPFVDDEGIYVPISEYAPEGCASNYRCVMTKDMFVEAYNKWIKKHIKD